MIYLDQPPAFAIEWCRKLGASLDTLKPLRGGINSQVFSCEAAGHRFVLKGHTALQTRGHDRFKAEVEFLKYAHLVTPEFVPQLLGLDEASKSLVLERLEGERFREGTHPSKEAVDRAVIFMRRLNTDVDLAKRAVSGIAVDGFLRLTEHLQNIQQRLEQMSLEHLPDYVRAEAKRLIESLWRRLYYLRESTEQVISEGHCTDELNVSERCISPSDFGFHNAIRTPKGIKFFDFEYAGWDDPTKAVADFDLQPRVPVEARGGVLSEAIPLWSQALAARLKALLPILELKWACIILGPLDPRRWTQMAMTRPDRALEPMLKGKLQLAQTFLSKD